MKKKKILITDVPGDKQIEKKIFGDNYDIYLTNINSFKSLSQNFKSKIDAILTGHMLPFNKNLIDQFKNCKAIARYGIGFNNIDILYAEKKNIKVFVVPDYGVDEVSDHALSLILAINRSIMIYDHHMRKSIKNSSLFWEYKINLNQKRLNNTKLGIIGLGRIGSSLARKAKALNMQVSYYDPYIDDGYDKVHNITKVDSLYELAKDSDVISVHVPYSEQNHNFLNEKFFNKIKKNKIIFINVSRGGLVSSKVLAKFYGNKISGIGLDVFENEPPNTNDEIIKLWKQDKNKGKIILSPHSAFYSKESYIELRSKASQTLKNYLEKKLINNSVN